MNKKVKFKLVYNRKNKLNKNGEALVQIEAYLNGKRKYFSTGIHIKPAYWDKKNLKVSRKHSEAQKLNLILFRQIKDLEDREIELIQKGLPVTLENLSNKQNSLNLFDLFQKYYDDYNVSKNRKQMIKRTLKYLKEFDNTLTFETFDFKKIVEFDNFLADNKHLAVNSIANHHKVVKAFFNYALKSDIIDKNPYLKFKIRKEKTQRQFLTVNEVEKIEQLKFEQASEHIAQVRDMFLFSCYTGLRFSDIQAIKPQMFDFTDDGVFLNLKQQKTKQVQIIPIHLLFNAKGVDLLKKYYDINKKYIFPRMTNQEANRTLKVIQVLSEINKVLTFHLSRHTFGTLLAKYSNDPYLIKQLMGHADIKTSMIYIHLNNEALNEKLKKIKW